MRRAAAGDSKAMACEPSWSRSSRLEDGIASFDGGGAACDSALVRFAPLTRPCVAITAPFVVPLAPCAGAGASCDSAFVRFTPPTRPCVAIIAPFVVPVGPCAGAAASPDSDTVSRVRACASCEHCTISCDGRTLRVVSRAASIARLTLSRERVAVSRVRLDAWRAGGRASPARALDCLAPPAMRRATGTPPLKSSSAAIGRTRAPIGADSPGSDSLSGCFGQEETSVQGTARSAVPLSLDLATTRPRGNDYSTTTSATSPPNSLAIARVPTGAFHAPPSIRMAKRCSPGEMGSSARQPPSPHR